VADQPDQPDRPYPPYPAYPPPGPPGMPPEMPLGMPPRVAAAPPGTPFHRLARTPLHRWWRPLAGTLFIAALGLVAAAVLLFAVGLVQPAADPGGTFGGTGSSDVAEATRILALNLGLLSLLTPVVLLAARVVQRRPAGSVLSVAGRVRWRWLFTCCGLAIGYCIVSVVLSYLTWGIFNGEEPVEPTGQWPGWADFLVPAAVILLLVPLQATAEEVVFRGWLLQGIAAWTPRDRTGLAARGSVRALLRTPWIAIVVSAALFTSVHGYTGWALLNIFCFGALAGWLAVRTGGLEASIALHIFTNVLGLLVLAASGQISDALEQGAAPFSAFLASMLALALYALAVVRIARHRRLPIVSPRPAPPGSPQPAPLAGPQ
jgi:membrane protease YdiL (CAAX protease family)